MSSIYGMVFDELDAMRVSQPEKFKEFEDAFNVLNQEDIAGIELDGKIYWVEYSRYGEPSEKGISQLRRYLKRRGYILLYEL